MKKKEVSGIKPAKKVAPKKKAAPKKETKAAPVKKTAAKKVTETAEKKVKVARKAPTNRVIAGVDLALVIAQGMFEKKAEDIRILDLRGLPGASTDFFVISHAVSDKQVEAIADSAEDETHKKTGEWARHREGYENLEWILLDYFDVVAHVFQHEKRDFYGLEELWGDAKEVPFKGK